MAAQTNETPTTVIDSEYLDEIQIAVETALNRADAGTVERTYIDEDRVVFSAKPRTSDAIDLIALSMREDTELRRWGVHADDIQLVGDGTIAVTLLRPILQVGT